MIPASFFGTGKFGDLAGFASTIALAMIALIIGYEAAMRLFAPVTIHFDEAILIATAGLVVNVVTAWLLAAAIIKAMRNAMGTGIITRDTKRMRMTRLAQSIQAGEFSFWRCSRTACHRASVCAAMTILKLRRARR
jgi:Co/Zn/Cd efflux system component